MSKQKVFQGNYKERVQIKGRVVYADMPIPSPEYGKLTVGLVVSPKVAQKFRDFVNPQIKAFKAQVGSTKNLVGLSLKPSVDSEGNEDGNFLLKFSRNPTIGDKEIKVPMVDIDGHPLDLTENLGHGSIVQVEGYCFFSKNAQGIYGRLEPAAIRVLELQSPVSHTEWEDDDEDDVPELNHEDASEGSSSGDDPDFI